MSILSLVPSESFKESYNDEPRCESLLLGSLGSEPGPSLIILGALKRGESGNEESDEVVLLIR